MASYVLGIIGLGRRSDLSLRLVCDSLDVEPLPSIVVEILAGPRDLRDGSGGCWREGEDGGEKSRAEQHRSVFKSLALSI